MKKIKDLKGLKKLIPLFFLLLIIEIIILGLKEGITFRNLLEIGSGLLLIIIYYFLVRLEIKMASKELEEKLKIFVNRFDTIEDDLKEELKILTKDIKDLKKIMEKK